MTTMTTHASRPPLFPATAAVWRVIGPPIRWLWQRKLKITLWTTTLITLAWQYENWHGRRAYQEQLALFRSEYGDMKWSDFSPPRIPDEENFFAAPVFETFVVKPPPLDRRDKDKLVKRKNELIAAMPHSRFLRLEIPEIKTVPCDWVPKLPIVEGCQFLDIKGWVQEEAKAGRQKPADLTDIQWLQSSIPEDDTVKGLIAALDRKKALLLPHWADCHAVGEAMEHPGYVPIPITSGYLRCSFELAIRARAAARAGDGLSARQHCEALWLLAEGMGKSHTYMCVLMGLSMANEANEATTEALACRLWTDADLVILRERMQAIDEETPLFASMYQEGFGHHFWTRIVSIFRESFVEGMSFPLINPDEIAMWLISKGPDGWVEASLAHHLDSCRAIMVPNGPGDDLLALATRLKTTGESINRGMNFRGKIPSPRKAWAFVLWPVIGGIADTALKNQTRRRELLLAIAIERHFLAKGILPRQAGDLVPAFIDAIPGDPWQPGSPLRWEIPERDATQPEAPAIRYRILSANKEATLGFPEKL